MTTFNAARAILNKDYMVSKGLIILHEYFIEAVL